MTSFVRNVGAGDRIARIVLGLAVLFFGLAQQPTAWWGWLGLIPLATGVVGWCPLYTLLRISTAGRRRSASRPTAVR